MLFTYIINYSCYTTSLLSQSTLQQSSTTYIFQPPQLLRQKCKFKSKSATNDFWLLVILDAIMQRFRKQVTDLYCAKNQKAQHQIRGPTFGYKYVVNLQVLRCDKKLTKLLAVRKESGK